MLARSLPLVAILTLSATVLAGPERDLFTFDPPGDAPVGATTSDDPSVVGAGSVRVDADVLRGLAAGARFDVPRSGAPALTIIVDESEPGPTGGRTFRGRVEDHPHGAARFVVKDGNVSGIVDLPGVGAWRLRPREGGHVWLEVDTTRLPGCGGTDPAADVLPRTAHAAGNDLCEDGSRIDVLIFYTPLARADAGGQAAVENEINLGVVAANEAYANSDIGFEIRVVGLQETDYDESTNYSGHLGRLADPDDGYMDEAHTLREDLSADLVALIVADGENCGIAWLMPANDPSSEDRGFSVTTWYCAANFVLAHELGHNMGACHAPGDGGGCSGGGIFEYSVGYRYFGNSGTQWRTVMAYSPGSRIPHFGNPQIQFDGRATGLSTNDNGRTLNETAQAIANYRRPACPGNAKDDCAVDFGDILKLLANWGAAGGPSDVTGDGTVDVRDLIFVLQNWGPCEYP